VLEVSKTFNASNIGFSAPCQGRAGKMRRKTPRSKTRTGVFSTPADSLGPAWPYARARIWLRKPVN